MEEKIVQLLGWLKDNGAVISPKVEFRIGKVKDKIYRGVFSTERIENGECLLDIPAHLTMNLKTARHHFAKHFDNYALQKLFLLDSTIIMAVFLLLEKCDTKQKSFFWPYIDSLPENIDNPMHWNQKELEYLQGTSVYNAVKIRKLDYENDIEKINDIFGKEYENIFTIQNYTWARSIISSRSFPGWLYEGIQNESRQDSKFIRFVSEATCEVSVDDKLLASPVLVPALDMLNHCLAQQVTWKSFRSSESHLIKFLAADDIPAKTEVFNNYGSKSNDSLLLGYGFVVCRNPFEKFCVKLNVSRHDDLWQYRSMALKKFGYHEIPEFEICLENILPSNLLTVISVLIANEAELGQFLSGKPFTITQRNQISCLEHLSCLLKNELEKLGQFKVNDEVKLTERLEMAITYREGQMNLLQKSLEKCLNVKKMILGENFKERFVSQIKLVEECPHLNNVLGAAEKYFESLDPETSFILSLIYFLSFPPEGSSLLEDGVLKLINSINVEDVDEAMDQYLQDVANVFSSCDLKFDANDLKRVSNQVICMVDEYGLTIDSVYGR
ncbi:hypothetical protein O9G_004489 [Rozella allomycis CSF55]|uniref:SET domain-containing protein n=1 Tax=Rozella allomycis (strain CSF55) TaxID=988480 RepID=A0A075AWZ6_ROZAC|nr:hypothetical protein O9G_004489 [Rozella allomycis CSF55]|eukprot:EPZ34777.1 hypothetical protein O9G_004489 [Rozella allomycis CSF55]